jgi:hypothetical protein
MNITKPGIVPDAPENKGKCTYCGCEFEFFSIEARRDTAPNGQKYFFVKCPQEGCWFTTAVPIPS